MVQKPLKTDDPTETDPFWYKNAVIYELHVRAFCDSSGSGRGDFAGLTQKLDYLQDLGVTALWLLPFYPSPLKDDGYDIADYSTVNPSFGTLHDFKVFLKAAHERSLKVITELVINHTSDQHYWFQRARRALPSSPWRSFYVWSDTPDRYKDARIIFRDFEASNWTWDPVAKAYFWHRFYSHQPDLNFENPQVQKAIIKIMDTWLKMGVDGLRLDAVPYLYEAEGTNCENLPATHEFLRRLRAHVDKHFHGRMLLAEANQWPEDAVAYFGAGNECHMAFHFPLMPRLFMGIRMEDRFPIIEILKQTPHIPENCQWAIFLRNHDELTLEMVTDEERDYMYRMYAHDRQARINLGIRRRLAPLLGNDRKKIELMNALLFSLPGTPVIYYGDEIGMGDNIYLGDRNGVRTPMQWGPDRNAGFSKANPQRLYLPVIIDPEYHHQAINVESQAANSSSLLWWTKRIIALRKSSKAFGQGSLEFIYPENRKILAFVRLFESERILVVANLSRFAQHGHLDLSPFRGLVPVELFGGIPFPAIDEKPYLVSLNPYGFYWFSLQASPQAEIQTPASKLPTVTINGGWENLFYGKNLRQVEKVLPAYIKKKRWFAGKASRIQSAEVIDVLPVENNGENSFIILCAIHYVDRDHETYLLPLAFAAGDEAGRLSAEAHQCLIAHVLMNQKGSAPEEPVSGMLYEAMGQRLFLEKIFSTIERKKILKGRLGWLEATLLPTFKQGLKQTKKPFEAVAAKNDQSNSSIIYGNQFILKLVRRLDAGTNPEWEIGKVLHEKGFIHTAPLAAKLDYYEKGKESCTCALVHGFVSHETNAWHFTLDTLSQYFERVLPLNPDASFELPHDPWPKLLSAVLPKNYRDTIGAFIESARLLGNLTAEMHTALASETENPDFVPEPFSLLSQRSLYQSFRNQAMSALDLLKNRLPHLSPSLQENARHFLQKEAELLGQGRVLLKRKISATHIRCHGDYHLAQVLYTGKDFVIVDFEGEPLKPISERRLKRSALKDVASMMRSFHYAAHVSLENLKSRGLSSTADASNLERWAAFWIFWVCTTFLSAYMQTAKGRSFVPQDPEEFDVLLNLYLLEKAFYEFRYELNNRPEWIGIPLKGLDQLLLRT